MKILAILFVAGMQGDGQEDRAYRRLEQALTELKALQETEERIQKGTELLVDIMHFQKQYPAGQKTLAMLEVLRNTHMEIGQTWQASGAVDRAEASFNGAVRAASELVEKVKGLQEKAQGNDAAMEEAERMRVYSERLYFASMHSLIVAISVQDGRLEEIRKRVGAMEEQFGDFMINYDVWVWALEASIYMGRTLEVLARAMGPNRFTDANDVWKRCFDFLDKARNLSENKDWRNDEFVLEMTLDATLFELKARTAYADVLQEIGVLADRQLLAAVELTHKIFTTYPRAEATPVGQKIAKERDRIRKRLGLE